MPVRHDDDPRELDYGGKTRDEETRDSLGMLALMFTLIAVALGTTVVVLWLLA